MSELLAPVGSKEAFYAAIANGCDAIYLGLDKHNARAYANNFNIENLKEYVDYAHLRNVRVFVTLNTIVFENELDEVYQMIDELAKMHVDAIIVQDLAVLNYAKNNYKSLEVHASTQMGIDDVNGAKFLKQLGVKRIVLARETPLNVIRNIKNETKLEVEAFIHGALCVSYSGNCFMSSAIGERSGNRGRCAGCCRKLYTLLDTTNNKRIKTGYLLSMKDLNLSSEIDKMDFVDSFKIEGRMKEPSYIASSVSVYRKLIDKQFVDKHDLDKIFNRTYTKGFINNASSKDITNINRPNNYGYLVGKVVKVHNKKIWIKLNEEVNLLDHIRIENENSFEDVNIVISKMFDASFKPIEKSNKTIIVISDKDVKIGSNVYKTKDVEFYKQLNLGFKVKEYKRLPLIMEINITLNSPILLKIKYDDFEVYEKSEYIVSNALKIETTKEDIINHLNKLNDTPYVLSDININLDKNVFVPVKTINELRRNALEKLNNFRLNKKVIINNEKENIIPKQFDLQKPKICVEVNNFKQYEFVKSKGIEDIYFNNIVRRNNALYLDNKDVVLVGGYGALEYYKNKNVKLVSDYSFNVTNHEAARLLFAKGVDRITLSNELSEERINDLIYKYKQTYNTNPNFELIVYGKAKIMHTLYCPLKREGMCGECKKNSYALKDNYETFPLLFNDDCTVNLLNSRTLNLIDEINRLDGINYFRLVFTNETLEEIDAVINNINNKLNDLSNEKCFNANKDTRGNFKKQLL